MILITVLRGSLPSCNANTGNLIQIGPNHFRPELMGDQVPVNSSTNNSSTNTIPAMVLINLVCTEGNHIFELKKQSESYKIQLKSAPYNLLYLFNFTYFTTKKIKITTANSIISHFSYYESFTNMAALQVTSQK